MSRVADWFRRWRPVLPILMAELIVWLGFGALLPVMPLYFREHGVDFATLGVVVAAWPAARLVGEPVFGWVADRTPRVPLMVAGNLLAGLFLFLPLVLIGPAPFIALRALAGLATAMYDPAARGTIMDSTPAERQGEAFGLYGAAQMGGLLLGPAIGGLGSALFGGIAFIFVFGACSSVLAALAIWLLVHETSGSRARPDSTAPSRRTYSVDLTEFPHEPDHLAGRAARNDDVGPAAAPAGLANRLLIAAILFNLGGNFAAGTYEVIWSLFLDSLGAGVELIGFTFAMFGLPVLVLSPVFGRQVDRGRRSAYLVVGSVLPIAAAFVYPVLVEPWLAVPLILVEATGFAMLSPALYAVVAAGSPAGRSATAQGLFGASGTAGFVTASLITGVIAETNIRVPFYVFAAVMTATTLAGFAVGGRRLGRPEPASDPGSDPGPETVEARAA
jgi:MFS family permease